MYELHRLIDKEPDYNCDDPIYAEYRALLAPMVEEFSPVVVMLVKAGLITMAIAENGENILHPSKRAVQMLPDCVSENGTIWLSSTTSIGCIPTHKSECEDKTCAGCNFGDDPEESDCGQWIKNDLPVSVQSLSMN